MVRRASTIFTRTTDGAEVIHKHHSLEQALTDCPRLCRQLSLAHFCETHGPTSILCTQVQPVSCLSCYPASISSSVGDLDATHSKPAQSSQESEELGRSNRSSLDFEDGIDTAPTSIGTSPELRSSDTANPDAHASDSLKPLTSIDRTASRKYRAFDSGSGCESCTIYIPEDTWKKLPQGAPGSPKANGLGRNGSPVLRSREALQVYGSPQYDSDVDEEPTFHHQSSPDSFASDASTSSYHKHTLTYISTSSPVDPASYSIVRNATVRTLSCELLPRGMTAGELSFGDPVNGYTIAYKFRLPDQHARGGYRQYALLALASNERRACQATTLVWTRFQHIAADVMARTEQAIQVAKGSVEDINEDSSSSLMPVSSFLTARMTDPDGFPRKISGVRPKARYLSEMVGDEKFFAELHLHFIGLLRDLRWRLGG